MIALIAIMAQIGSYVPATSVKLGLLDSVLTRMGGVCIYHVLLAILTLASPQPPMTWPEDAPLLWSKCLKRVKSCTLQRIAAW